MVILNKILICLILKKIMGKHTYKRESSSTPGKSKGANCQKSELKTQFAKDSRMYRTDPKKFAQAEEIVRALNKK